MPQLEQRDYERLLAFRTGLRRFLSWSGQRAVAAGLVFRQTDAEDARTVRIALTPWDRSVSRAWPPPTRRSSTA
jgi:hypothetical protein